MTNSQSRDTTRGFTFTPALLRTESKEDFEKLLAELNKDVQPASFVQRLYVHDIAHLTFEIIRHRLDKVNIVNNAFHRALAIVLKPILQRPKSRSLLDGTPLIQEADPAAQLAYDYSVDEQSKDKVLGLLKKAGFDMRAVETEALTLSLDDVERVDRLIASAEVRRKKALRFIAWHGENFAERLERSSEQMLAADAARSDGAAPIGLAN
jgi:hypothetical protein